MSVPPGPPAFPDLSRLSNARLADDRTSIYAAKVERRRRAMKREAGEDPCAYAKRLRMVLDAVSLDLEMAKEELRNRVEAERILRDLIADIEKALARSEP